jgi:hypothetical protein
MSVGEGGRSEFNNQYTASVNQIHEVNRLDLGVPRGLPPVRVPRVRKPLADPEEAQRMRDLPKRTRSRCFILAREKD